MLNFINFADDIQFIGEEDDGAIADLTAEFVGTPGDETLQFNTAGATDAVSYQFRWRLNSGGTYSSWLAVGTALPASIAQNTLLDLQIRGVGVGGKKGPASNTATATTPYNFPGQIGDLEATISGKVATLTFTASEDATGHEYRVDGGSWTTLSGFTVTLAAFGTDYDIEVRGINPTFNGAASNLVEVTTDPASITFRDIKAQTVTGNGAPSLVLSTLGLSKAAGCLVVVGASARGVGTSGTGSVVQGTITGWNEIGFAAHNPATVNANGIRLFWKVIDDTEDLVDPFVVTVAGTTQYRRNYVVASFDIVGDVTLGASPTAAITTADPTGQTIAAAAGALPHLALSFAHAFDSTPDQTFVGQTVGPVSLTTSSGGPSLRSRLKGSIVTASPSDITTDFGDLGDSNGLVSGFLTVT